MCLCLENVQPNGFYRKAFLISPARGEVVEERKEERGQEREDKRQKKGREKGTKWGNRKERAREEGKKCCMWIYVVKMNMY